MAPRVEGNYVIYRDDDAGGYELRILRSEADGDFHLSIWPCEQDMELDERMGLPGLYSNTMRIRMPMIGGGSHEELYRVLLTLWRKAGKR